MTLDVRTPTGALFLVLGGLLTVYGVTSDPSIYHRSLGVNVNFGSGVAMIGFGAAMLLWRRFSRS